MLLDYYESLISSIKSEHHLNIIVYKLYFKFIKLFFVIKFTKPRLAHNLLSYVKSVLSTNVSMQTISKYYVCLNETLI